MEMQCEDCGWTGSDSELVNPGGLCEEYYVDGDCCPRCESDNVIEADG